jgi:hypothetical protein
VRVPDARGERIELVETFATTVSGLFGVG